MLKSIISETFHKCKLFLNKLEEGGTKVI